MNVPKRWLEGGDGISPQTRDLLRAGLDAEPPPGANDAVWAALTVKLGPLSGGGGAAGGDPGTSAITTKAGALGAAKTASSAGVLTSLLAGAFVAGIGVVVYSVAVPDRPLEAAPLAVMTSVATRPVDTPRAVAPGPGPIQSSLAAPGPALPEVPASPPLGSAATPIEPAPARPASPAENTRPQVAPSASTDEAPHPSAPAGAVGNGASVAPGEQASRLREESQMVSGARALLRSGQAVAALGLLEQARLRFPGGMLVQEREALVIEALAQAGQRAAARERAAAFLRAYPSSPHAPRLQVFAE